MVGLRRLFLKIYKGEIIMLRKKGGMWMWFADWWWFSSSFYGSGRGR